MLRLQSPAKINLGLRITGRCDDGYHELDTLLCPVSLYDRLTLEIPEKEGLTLAVDGPFSAGVPADGANLVYRAAALFFARLGQERKIHISVGKNIPAGAGLGGGSGNAAAVLYGLNRLYGDPLSPAELSALGLKLGADVPFFLLQGPARALGIGEELTPWKGKFHFGAVIIFPGFGVSTAKIYGNFKLALTNTPKNSICLEAKKNASGDFALQNDLEASALELFPEIASVKQAFYDAGFARVLMSGSGSAVFGLCTSLTEAEKLAAKIKIKAGWHVFTVEILNNFDIVP